jgi:hypothetical protein
VPGEFIFAELPRVEAVKIQRKRSRRQYKKKAQDIASYIGLFVILRFLKRQTKCSISTLNEMVVTNTQKGAEAAQTKGDNLVDAPPSYSPYSPRSASPLPAAGPATPRRDYPQTVELPTDRIHVPGPSFSQDLSKVHDTPANVVCPRCHYGVQTQVRSVCGTHAGYTSWCYADVVSGQLSVVWSVESSGQSSLWLFPRARISNTSVLIVSSLWNILTKAAF